MGVSRKERSQHNFQFRMGTTPSDHFANIIPHGAADTFPANLVRPRSSQLPEPCSARLLSGRVGLWGVGGCRRTMWGVTTHNAPHCLLPPWPCFFSGHSDTLSVSIRNTQLQGQTIVHIHSLMAASCVIQSLERADIFFPRTSLLLLFKRLRIELTLTLTLTRPI